MICSGKHCAWCAICLSEDEAVSCDSCLMQLVTQKLFNEIVSDLTMSN